MSLRTTTGTPARITWVTTTGPTTRSARNRLRAHRPVLLRAPLQARALRRRLAARQLRAVTDRLR